MLLEFKSHSLNCKGRSLPLMCWFELQHAAKAGSMFGGFCTQVAHLQLRDLDLLLSFSPEDIYH